MIVRPHPGEPQGLPERLPAPRPAACKTYDGRCSEIRCPFHGFTWHLDGTLRGIPAEWDFPHLRRPPGRAHAAGGPRRHVGRVRVPQPRPGRRAAPRLPRRAPRPLRALAPRGPVPPGPRGQDRPLQLEGGDGGLRRGLPRLGHAPAGHRLRDGPGQPDRHLRELRPPDQPVRRAVAAHHVGGQPRRTSCGACSTSARASRCPSSWGRARPRARPWPAPPATRWRPVLGDRIEEFCDAELVDHFNYTVFPNIHPWGGFNRIVYRFRPNGDDHETSIFEVMYVTPFAGERPAPATLRSLGADDRWTDAPELDSLGMVLDQDTFNMEQVQKGLKILRRDGVTRLALPGGHRPLAPGPPRRVGRAGDRRHPPPVHPGALRAQRWWGAGHEGRRGRALHRDGRWIAGELREADPELCLWLSANRPARHHRLTRSTTPTARPAERPRRRRPRRSSP